METVKQKSEYNKVFELYVDDDCDALLDLPGLIAYGLYKKQKREVIIALKKENEGKSPSDEEVKTATLIHTTPNQRSVLREQAQELLTVYADEYVNSLEPEIQKEALQNEAIENARAIRQDIKRSNGYVRQVFVGMSSALAWTLLLIIAAIASALFGIDPIEGIQQLLGTTTA